MIRHIVSWQLAETEPAAKARVAAEIASRLTALVGVVDEIRSLRVDADVAGGTNWDVVLVADFDDLAAVGRYQVHPAHQAAGTYIRSVVTARMAVDILL
ncbi:Dabb family protein [Cryobacterium sp. TMT1-21]|uniref:Dabb family protein n=1 Tax=Cryobacterium shii TaxID=1259235 RepID=A0AAQ2HF98_9MICO|nr:MULTISPECIES: Dabb family protein [Cryobacterium]TFC45614.1 Dabb family protein [Cryobacterium shii]TFD16481.1 Dabb family protein [Cryobacterium sp. TMT1-21]TFD16929.1 Dabb family protein [Cryobacterium sp. TMT4-10]TFD23605.1 Dabb family protein [Cryobacterium sp. TMT2-23]TFD37503.1 Dabb family protein [Cryobacterium sp. TMT2-10]